MNIKKYLQEQAKKDAERLLAQDDKEFIKRLIQKIEENDKKESTEKLLKNDSITS